MDMALVAVQSTDSSNNKGDGANDEQEDENGISKKQRKEYDLTLAISAAAGTQPRRGP